MSDDKPKDTSNRVSVEFDEVSDPTVIAERRSDDPISIAVVMDATKSRESNIESSKIDFESQMRRLKQIVEEVSSLVNLQIGLFTFGENGPVAYGFSHDPMNTAQIFNDIECTQAPTQICSTLYEVKNFADAYDVSVDAALVIGDSVDSGRVEEFKNNPNIFPDTLKNLGETGLNFGAPIITMLDETELRDGEGTHWFDRNAMQQLSESSGVQGCPVDHDTDITFVDYVASVAAMRVGPEAVRELKDSGLVNEEVWESFPEKTQDTIYKPDPIRIIYQEIPSLGEDLILENQRLILGNRRRITGWGLLTSTLAAAGLACCILRGCADDSTTPVVMPVPAEPVINCGCDTGLVETDDIPEEALDFDESGRITFNEASHNQVNQQVNFERDSDTISPSFEMQLNQLGELLERNPGGFDGLIITGHTSTLGTEEYNLELSLRRAQSVVDYLEANFEISFPLEARGAGESEPIFMGDYTADDVLIDSTKAEANRRVVFQAVLGR